MLQMKKKMTIVGEYKVSNNANITHSWLQHKIFWQYLEFKQNCYFPSAFKGKITGPYPPAVFNTAKSNCEAMGQKLLTIDSQEEEDSLSSLITQE